MYKHDKSLGAKPIVSQNSGVLFIGRSSEHLQGVLNLFHLGILMCVLTRSDD